MKIGKTLANPVSCGYRMWASFDSAGLWRRYASLARAAGLQRLYLILSLDCDTVEDITVVPEVHARLLDLGIKPVYAVPGKLLRKGEKVYLRLQESGGEFLNHGYAEHTFWDPAQESYESCFYYDRLTREQVLQDIRAGDECLREILGVTPQGFRSPHFGTFQRPEQLRFLHAALRELGYRFSSSTMPLYAFRYGPVFNRFGLLEIPVSGRKSAPLNILDSCTCFISWHSSTMSPRCYQREGEALAEMHTRQGVGLLNYYVDPSHVYNQEPFYQTVDCWRRIAHPVNYEEFLAELLPGAPPTS